jgi:hypothetical protein
VPASSNAEPDIPAMPMTTAEMLQSAQSIADPEMRQKVVSKLNTRLTIEKTVEAERDERMTESINTKVEAATPGTSLRQALSPQEYAWAAENGKLPAWERRMQERVAGTEQVTDPQLLLAYRAVVAKAAQGDANARAELKKYNPYDPALKMSMSDRDWLAKAKEAIASGDPNKTAKAVSEGELNAIVKQYTISNLGVPEKQIGKDTDQGRTAWRFYNDLRTWVDNFEREHSRSPSFKEVQQQADVMTLEALTFKRTEPGMLWGTTEVEAKVGDLGIPPEMRTQIVEALRTEGKPVNGDNVAAKWRAYLKKTQGAQ